MNGAIWAWTYEELLTRVGVGSGSITLYHSGHNGTSRVPIHKDTELYLCVFASFSQQWGLRDASPFFETTDRGSCGPTYPVLSRTHPSLESKYQARCCFYHRTSLDCLLCCTLRVLLHAKPCADFERERCKAAQGQSLCITYSSSNGHINGSEKPSNRELDLIIIYLLRYYVPDMTTSSEI